MKITGILNVLKKCMNKLCIFFFFMPIALCLYSQSVRVLSYDTGEIICCSIDYKVGASAMIIINNVFHYLKNQTAGDCSHPVVKDSRY